jgi:hypothetical protein
LPRALGPWALDSGGFTELDKRGGWSITPRTYVGNVRRFAVEIGNLEWAAPMDWMCEPKIRHRTGLTVEEHQARTVANYLELRELAPDLPFVPVLQGWVLDDYLRCIDLYLDAGIDLTAERLVGVGTVCRREATREIHVILGALADCGLSLHGFGCKKQGLRAGAHYLESADSLAWSSRGQHVHPVGCVCTNCERKWSRPSDQHCGGTHTGEQNCRVFALRWRDAVLREIDVPKQLAFGAA